LTFRLYLVASIVLTLICASGSYGSASGLHVYQSNGVEANGPGPDRLFFLPTQNVTSVTQTRANTTSSENTTTQQESSSSAFPQMPLPPVTTPKSSDSNYLIIAAVAVVLVTIVLLRLRRKKSS
jgi:ABC-type transport system involved in multi-copper enzyme maturation permease subunit